MATIAHLFTAVFKSLCRVTPFHRVLQPTVAALPILLPAHPPPEVASEERGGVRLPEAQWHGRARAQPAEALVRRGSSAAARARGLVTGTRYMDFCNAVLRVWTCITSHGEMLTQPWSHAQFDTVEPS